MREGAKQRLVGAVVIVALAVIFVPMLFEQKSIDTLPPIQESIPLAPDFDPDIRSEVFLGPEDSGVGGLEEGGSTESQPLSLPPAGDLEPASNEASLIPEPLPPPEEPVAPVVSKEPVPLAEPRPVAPKGPSDGMPAWVIQVASLATPQSAAELEKKLRDSGFSAFVERAEVRGRLYYRVRVGPEVDRANAERTAADLRSRFRVDTLIKRYP